MTQPVYILIRTSRRPEFFRRCMASVKAQDYPHIITIVHTDDPRDDYVTGDIIIRGRCYGSNYGNAPYNLYNNRLLQAIPSGDGWYHFIDDDDEYAAPDVISKLVAASDRDAVNVARVRRWDNVIFPRDFGKARSYQTECFFMHTDHKDKARWWPHRGGDHNYSKQLTRVMPINWIDDLIIARAQEGKGNGKQLDAQCKKPSNGNFESDDKVCVLGLCPHRSGFKRDWIEQGKLRWLNFSLAIELEKKQIVKITYPEGV